MNFNERLQKYRKSRGIEKKKDMAKILGISESYYNLLENGAREPSKNFLRKLVIESEKPDEYWLYGITDKKEYLNKREEFKCMKDLVEQLEKIGLLDIEKEFTEGVKEVILAAAIADINHILEKRKQS